MKEIKCYRCGKIHSAAAMKLRKSWACPHCHGVMVLDLPTQRKLKYVRMLFVALIVSLLMYGCSQLGTVSSYVALIITCSAAIVLTQFSDQLCLWLTDKLFGLTYMPVEKDRNSPVKSRQKGK
ncbi:hypothetical protein [Holdemania massiliensis]|uniref:Uncharacterized protein n=1 Tax=Holdemania massiliensis TaxID=1468449 RepID=A0A6N7S3B9_9FIRM|nr:hypothetical protein [Holdemania massiliensis]MSA70299.1 hypothetical protein [Holdemania massiliensis]MSA88170.1 hypothetical protein [Holdemania massiliensis]MSB76999.1 hypothetical protein [Holdemania massiliensis]MSC31925.1 hypothetical protein [Holdemania massiliensis]MSC38245.1 hypothetical protein [Holdemania massiliensis]